MTQRICKFSDITEKVREFRVSSKNGPFFMMIFRRGDRMLAYHNSCPHRHLSLNFAPDRFLVGNDGSLVCAHHGAVFDLNTGLCLQGPCEGASLQAIEISIRDDEVWLK